jgi:hypothetical protein
MLEFTFTVIGAIIFALITIILIFTVLTAIAVFLPYILAAILYIVVPIAILNIIFNDLLTAIIIYAFLSISLFVLLKYNNRSLVCPRSSRSSDSGPESRHNSGEC